MCLCCMLTGVLIPTQNSAADPVQPSYAIGGFTTGDMTPFMDVEGWTDWVAAGAVLDEVELYVKAYTAVPKVWAFAAGIAIDKLAKMFGLAGQEASASQGNLAAFRAAIAAQVTNAMQNVKYNMDQELSYGALTNDVISSRVHWAAKAMFEEQKANGEPYNFDYDRIIFESDVYKDALLHVQNAVNHYKANLAILDRIGNTFVGDYAGENIRASYTGSGSSLIASATYNNNYFVPTFEIKPDGYWYGGENELWLWPKHLAGEFNLTIRNKANEIVTVATANFTSYCAQKLTLNLSLGTYKFDAGNLIVFGMVVPAMVNGATTKPAVVVLNPFDGMFTAIYYGNYGVSKHQTQYDATAVFWHYLNTGGSTNNPSQLSFSMPGYGMPILGTTYGNPTNNSQHIQHLQGMKALLDQAKTMLTTAVGSAQAAYNVATTLGEWPAVLISPTDIFPYGDRMENFTAAQWAIAYHAWLKTVTEWSSANGNYIEQIFASPEALDLVIRGNVYAPNGSMTHENIIFTPYVSKEMNLTKGQYNTLAGTSFLVSFGKPGQTVANATSDNIRLIDVANGSSIYITEMERFGEPIDTIHLTVLALQELTLPDQELAPAPPQEMDEWDLLVRYWYYAVLVFGVILLLGGIIIKSPYVILAGIIFAAIGAFVALTDGQSILSTMAAPFLPDWWPW